MPTEPKRDDELEPGAEEEFVPEDDRIIGHAFRWSLAAAALVAGIAALVLFGSREQPEAPALVARGPIELPRQLDQSQAALPLVPFRDVTRAAGIDFVHENGARGEKLLPETMGAGVAFLDYDADGDQDLLFVNSRRWSAGSAADATPALYRNDGSGRFENVTAGSGLDVSFYGQGVAVGDYDNDGAADVFVSALGSNHLFRNAGGRFEEVTARAGVAGDARAWSTSAGFFDVDNDGDLDLFVCNYVAWSREVDLELHFTLNGVDRAYGPPKLYEGTHSYLYRNDGDGRFSDISAQAGIQIDNPATGRPMGKALALTFADADRDGDLDVFVANDTVQNFVFRNDGGGAFSELGAESGFAFDNNGAATGAMGIDAADFDNRGALAVGVGNFANETSSFYVQQNDPWQFVDVANAYGIGSPSRLKLSFGLFFFDYDLDGRLDLLQSNGHLEDGINEIQPSQTYRQAAQLFWNCGTEQRGCFAAVADERLGDLARPIVGRGAAYGDIDGDGDLDVVLTQTGGPPLLIRNDQDLGHHWLRVRLVGRRSNRDAIGAVIELRAGGTTQRRQVMPTRSYLSQVEMPVTFGLGAAGSIEWLRVVWPDGSTQEIAPGAIDTSIAIVQSS
ncbi:MAG: CRTAC1 family protein [Myxococcales bacterium]|nr:CRTAC1 family protein [Myxococcales bacterium]MDH5565078.1 CRTAC1 family protein [Myxococcales bacterium]